MQTKRCSRLLIATVAGLVTVAGTARPVFGFYQGSNLVFNVLGTVSVSRLLGIFSPVRSEAWVSPKHQIKVAANSRVSLRCKNTTVHSLSPGIHKVEDYCGKERTQRLGVRSSSRAPFNPSQPNVLSPRNTALLDGERLLIRWTASPGATSYGVRIKGIDWAGETTQTELVYEGTDSFKPNYRYSIEVTGDNGEEAETGITILPAAEVQRVAAEVEQIRALGLEPDIEAISLALVYLYYENDDPDWRSYALNDAALAVLAERVEAGTENSQIYLLQGDAYLEIGLPLLARTSYEQSLALAEAAMQLEWQAESLLGFGAVAEKQTEYEDALHYYAAATEVYEQLENGEAVNILQARIESLKDEV